jgi:hypothetical protein
MSAAIADTNRQPINRQGGIVMPYVSAPSRRWSVLALAVIPIFLLAGCSSSNAYPVASPAVSSTCSDLDKYFLDQTAPKSELNMVLNQAKKSGDPVLESGAHAYETAVLPLNQSKKNEAFAKMVGRCQYYGIGPNQNP